jgi:hypothetical protein
MSKEEFAFLEQLLIRNVHRNKNSQNFRDKFTQKAAALSLKN